MSAPRLLVPVTEVRRRLGTQAPVARALPAHGLALSDVSVPEGTDIDFVGTIESISEGIVLTGDVTVAWVGACRRCLREVEGVAVADVREIYETHPTDGETWPLVDDQIDLGPLLHDTALLALPLAPLCAEDCAGPAPEEFPTGPAGADADDADAEGGPPRDPRWAALDDLTFE
ncbi:MAG: DUF177 domain-containing protein [Actinobacteria bacterium]|nr:DUF177 domain-containing protein [Actinomycetota bacterium]